MRIPDGRVIVYAKPSATNVFPTNIIVLNSSISSTQVKNVAILGKSFFNILNVYLSGSDSTIFENLNYSYYNPFSALPKLSAKNVGFYGTVIDSFSLIDDKTIIFEIPEQVFYSIQSKAVPYDTFLDVVVENEAGYGLLTRDSYSYTVSSWTGFVNIQKPSISGIYVTLN